MSSEQWLQAAVLGLAAFTARIVLQFVAYLVAENKTLRSETLAAIMAMAKAVTASMLKREHEHAAIMDAIREGKPKRDA